MAHLGFFKRVGLIVEHESQLRARLERQPSVLSRPILPQVLARRHIVVVIRSDFLLLGLHYFLERRHPRQLPKVPIGPLVRHQERLHHATVVECVGFLFGLKVLPRLLLLILNLLLLYFIEK